LGIHPDSDCQSCGGIEKSRTKVLKAIQAKEIKNKKDEENISIQPDTIQYSILYCNDRNSLETIYSEISGRGVRDKDKPQVRGCEVKECLKSADGISKFRLHFFHFF
jgi:hypothetical protein